MQSNVNVSKAMTITLPKELPPEPVFKEGIRRAPDRGLNLSKNEIKNCFEECIAIYSRGIA